MIDPVLLLKEGLALDADAGDPILRVLRGRGYHAIEVFMVWLDLTTQADACYYEALNSGMSGALAYDLLNRKKEELAALLERELS
jgi:hypothetical protein